MRTIDLIKCSSRKLCILIGSRPGIQYTGLTDREIFERADRKVLAVKAFVQKHDPDIIFTIAGMVSEAESLGAEVLVKDDGSAVVMHSPLAGNPDPSLLSPLPLHESPLCSSLIESVRLLSDLYPHRIVAASLNGPLTVMGQLLGVDRLLLLSADDPQLIMELLAPVTRRIIELLNAQIESGARYVHVAEPTGSLLSPGSLREIGLPQLQKLFAHVTVPNHLHMCGDVNAHLGVLAETGAGAVSVDRMVDMKKAAEHFGGGMAVCGNMDSAGILFSGSPEEVAHETRMMLEWMATVNGYIPASSCGIPKLTPPENIESFIRTVRNFNE